jgi:hypothetical protein
MSRHCGSLGLLDLPDQALAEITKYSRDRDRWHETQDYQPFLRLARQGRDGVLRGARMIRLQLAAGDTDEAAVQPLASLLSRASRAAPCEELKLCARDGLHDQLFARLFAKLLESCQPWPSVLKLDLQVCLAFSHPRADCGASILSSFNALAPGLLLCCRTGPWALLHRACFHPPFHA